MLIIEGADCTGKSELVRQLRSMNFSIAKPYYPKRDQISYYLHSASLYGKSILERYYLSELVYPHIKSDRTPMPNWYQYIIEAAILPYNPIIVYLRPDNDIVKKNILVRGDEYISESEVDKMLEVYDETIAKSHVPHIKYNFQKDNPELLTQSLYYMKKERAPYLSSVQDFLHSGMAKKGSTIIIGSDPSDKSIGEGYIRAFVSHKGSSEFLHKSLYLAGVYDKEMPYFTNWGKGFDRDEERRNALKKEISVLKPRKIICLGKELKEKIGLDENIEVLEHPSYVRRFHSKDSNWYIDKIKDLFKD